MKRFCEKFKIVVFLCHKIHAKVNMTYLLVKDDRVFTIFSFFTVFYMRKP